MDIFQEVSVSLSLMDFSQKLQVFFSCAEIDCYDEENNHQPIQLVVLGNNVGNVVQNAYIMSLEHGEKCIDMNYYTRASEIQMPYIDILKNKDEITAHKIQPQLVCPFNVIIKEFIPNNIPRYFKQIEKIASRPLVNERKGYRGYKFTNIHMRLGNKVHTDSFYELSFLFYRTSVANRVAFYILQKIKDDLYNINGDIVFYGYASYSQAIIFSLKEMFEEYLKNNPRRNIYNIETHYATFQYNLQSESFYSNAAKNADKIKIFSTLKIDNNKKKNTFVVQIVPIGSTLTTFDKMRAKYLKGRNLYEKSNVIANFNVFLAHDNDNNKDKISGCSKIEKEFWNSIDTNKQIVNVNIKKLIELSSNPNINYIINRKSEWWHPIECEQCFPETMQEEEPLIETDPTSTVPALQIYQKSEFSENNSNGNDFSDSLTNNILRLSELNDCVYYGHLLRGKYHYQYYIDTQEYISKTIIKINLINWLTEKRVKENNDKKRITPLLNIIFSPEHNTNVGFSQLVNAYYFNGTAEVVSVNVDKQFRSNFICEHDALRQTIERLHMENPNEEELVRFFFVDDSIISGSSYHRARDLLKSLIPDDFKDKYPVSVFSKCFVLVNRLSLATQETYIHDTKNNFLSFCNINISNVRKQGDSCVGCKLEREAKYLLKRSSTRSLANHWANKSESFSPVMFDDVSKLINHKKGKAYIRLLLTHVFGNLIEKRKMGGSEAINNILKLILYESSKPLNCEKRSDGTIINIKDDEETALVKEAFKTALQCDTNGTPNRQVFCLLEHAVKLLTRPFIFYNLELKKDVLKFIINACEFILMDETQIPSEYEYIKEIKNIIISSDPQKINLLNFIQNCLFEAFADMKSTYLLRKATIKKVFKFTMQYEDNEEAIRSFWKEYSFNIHKIIDGGGDETRSLWMEYLLIFGEEHPVVIKNKKPSKEGIPLSLLEDSITTEKESVNKIDLKKEPKKGRTLPLFEEIVPDKDSKSKAAKLFKEFCIEIFFQNTRLLYDGIKKYCENEDNQNIDENSYFFDNLIFFHKWDLSWASVVEPNEKITDSEKNLFRYINDKGTAEKNTDFKYNKLICNIIEMASQKYGIINEKMHIVLLTQESEKNDTISKDLDKLKFITNIINYKNDDKNTGNSENNDLNTTEEKKKDAREKYMIKKRIIHALKEDVLSDEKKIVYGSKRLKEDGYFLVLPVSNSIQNINNKKKIEIDWDRPFDFESDYKPFENPCFILCFDNDKIYNKLDSDVQHIEKVYIYASISFEKSEFNKKIVAPILIMRDILSYRDCIMNILEKDFNSYLMRVATQKTVENTIFKHEKTVNHTSTSDDKFPTILWEKNKALNAEEYEWLLFRNYTNNQIAKLFKRTLLHSDSKEKTSSLHISNNDKNIKNSFNFPAKYFI